jgi:hypothetical protein
MGAFLFVVLICGWIAVITAPFWLDEFFPNWRIPKVRKKLSERADNLSKRNF